MQMLCCTLFFFFLTGIHEVVIPIASQFFLLSCCFICFVLVADFAGFTITTIVFSFCVFVSFFVRWCFVLQHFRVDCSVWFLLLSKVHVSFWLLLTSQAVYLFFKERILSVYLFILVYFRFKLCYNRCCFLVGWLVFICFYPTLL